MMTREIMSSRVCTLVLAGILVLLPTLLVVYHRPTPTNILQQQELTTNTVWEGRISQLFRSSSHSSSSSSSRSNNHHDTNTDDDHHHTTLPQRQQDDKNKNDKQNKRRRRLILHVGPSKTATTSLQTDMTKLQDNNLLQTNGYLYAGRYYRPYTLPNGTLILNRSETSVITKAHNMLKKKCPYRNKTECCFDFVKTLNEYSTSDQDNYYNVILSEEPFGNQWRHVDDWKAIHDALIVSTGTNWDVTVVIGYRHYYEWFVSSRFQHERLDRNKHRTIPWPNEAGGKAIPEFFPYWWNHYNVYFSYTTDILHAINDTFSDIRLINLHNEQNLTPLSIFLCDILDISSGLSQCDETNQVKEETTVMNTRQSSMSLYYDAIATSSMQYINTTKYTRSVVRASIATYWEETRQMQPHDLPMTCPEPFQLEMLWNKSWSYEQLVWPKLTSTRSLEEQEQIHRSGFDDYVSKQVFCWINSTTILNDPQWQEFLINQFSH